MIDIAIDAKFMLSNSVKRDIKVFIAKSFWIVQRKSLGKHQRDQKGLEFGKDDYDQIDKYCKQKHRLVCISPDLKAPEFLKL